MIHYTNIKRHDNLPWEEYLLLPGYSNSFLKSERNGLSSYMEETDKMRLGKLVDAIITGGSVNMSSEMYPIARDIASKITGTFGTMITRFDKQVAFSATANYGGFSMPVRGLLDFLLPKTAVIDLKVIHGKSIEPTVSHFGYDNQLWHYGKLAGVTKGYLMVYSVPLKKTTLINMDISNQRNEFFEDKILKFGTV